MPQATVPNPRTWSTGDYVTVPRLRADVADAVAFLGQRPYFVGQRSLGDAWASGTALGLPMDIELTDYWGGHLAPPASGTGNYWAPVPGWYLCDARIAWNYTSTTAAPFYAGFQGLTSGAAFGPTYGAPSVNGSGSGTTSRSVDLIEQVNGGSPNGSGDYIQPVARQDSGGTVDLNSSAQNLPTVSVRWACATSGTEPLSAPPLTAVPSPITSAWLNANVRDTIRYLIYPPCGKAYYTAGSSSLANSSLSSPAVVPLTTTALDTYGGFTTGSSAKYTIPVAGRYLVAGTVSLASSSTTTYYAAGLYVNSSALYWGGITRFAGSSLVGGASVTRRIRFNAGDTVQLVAAQASGGSIAYNTTAANQTRLVILWEGL